MADGEGMIYRDALPGIAVNTPGHKHPERVAAIAAPAGSAAHLESIPRASALGQ